MSWLLRADCSRRGGGRERAFCEEGAGACGLGSSVCRQPRFGEPAASARAPRTLSAASCAALYSSIAATTAAASSDTRPRTSSTITRLRSRRLRPSPLTRHSTGRWVSLPLPPAPAPAPAPLVLGAAGGSGDGSGGSVLTAAAAAAAPPSAALSSPAPPPPRRGRARFALAPAACAAASKAPPPKRSWISSSSLSSSTSAAGALRFRPPAAPPPAEPGGGLTSAPPALPFAPPPFAAGAASPSPSSSRSGSSSAQRVTDMPRQHSASDDVYRSSGTRKRKDANSAAGRSRRLSSWSSTHSLELGFGSFLGRRPPGLPRPGGGGSVLGGACSRTRCWIRWRTMLRI